MARIPILPLRHRVRAVPTAGAIALTSLLACKDGTSPPAQVLHVVVEQGDLQTGLSGYALNIAPAVRLRDQANAAVAGVQVGFTVSGGGGSVTGGTTTTNSLGVARVGSWVVQAGTNTLAATVAGSGITGNPVIFTATGVAAAYDISLQFLVPVTPERQAVFESAAVRWERLIYGDVPDIVIPAGDSIPPEPGCGTPTIKGTIDDILIFATLDSIDGPGHVVGRAGPCFIRTSGFLSLVGVMHFDTADVADMQSSGLFQSVILHEMGHVLGFGTLWGPTELNLLVGPSATGGTDPHFIGAQAIAAFDAHGGAGYSSGTKIPLENCLNPPPGSPCGDGQRDVHWRQSVFGNELMTPYFTSLSSPLSVITTASMEDEGYRVNYAASDPYTVAHPLATAPLGGGAAVVDLRDDIIRLPVYAVDRSGRVTGVIRWR